MKTRNFFKTLLLLVVMMAGGIFTCCVKQKNANMV